MPSMEAFWQRYAPDFIQYTTSNNDVELNARNNLKKV
jgi:hypothetical protein